MIVGRGASVCPSIYPSIKTAAVLLQAERAAAKLPNLRHSDLMSQHGAATLCVQAYDALLAAKLMPCCMPYVMNALSAECTARRC